MPALRLRREPGPVERREQEISRPIPREDPPGPVPAVRRRGQPHDDQRRLWISEPGHRPPPVRLAPVRPALLSGHLLSPGHQPWTPPARDHGLVERRERPPCRGLYHSGRSPFASAWTGAGAVSQSPPSRTGPRRAATVAALRSSSATI